MYNASLMRKINLEEAMDTVLMDGVEKGRWEEKLSIAMNLKKKGMSIKDISETTDLVPKEIESL